MKVNSIVRMSILYGEALMVTLHLWVMSGVLLPNREKMENQPAPILFGYLISDLSLPIIAARMKMKGKISFLMKVCIFLHTILYVVFLWDKNVMSFVTSWAYSSWMDRISITKDSSAFAPLAVSLDTICHSWGLISTLQDKKIAVADMAVIGAGIAVGVSFIFLSNS
mmetsp:Transcript_14459/g.22069  ORF Transcript_14459/g.22069 Transcript_14459/m.22069 type:complete len:167 (-) Transcript_14459:11-511(-)